MRFGYLCSICFLVGVCAVPTYNQYEGEEKTKHKTKKIITKDEFENLTCDEIENTELYQMFMRMQRNACWMGSNEKDRDKIQQARKKALTPSEQKYWDSRIMVSYFDHFDFTTRGDPTRDLIIDPSNPLPDKKEEANLIPAGCDISNCASLDEKSRSEDSDGLDTVYPRAHRDYDYGNIGSIDYQDDVFLSDDYLSGDSFMEEEQKDTYAYLIQKNVTITNKNGELVNESHPNCEPTVADIDGCIKRVHQPMPVSQRARIQACGIYKNQCRHIKSLWLYEVDSAFTKWLLKTATKDQTGKSHGSVLQSITTMEDKLIVNNVKGLTNLGELFPNFALIQGVGSGFREMALNITENSDLEELGLKNLRYILNKSVHIKDNPRLIDRETFIDRLNPKEHDDPTGFFTDLKKKLYGIFTGEIPSTPKKCKNEGCKFGCMDVKKHGKMDETKEICIGCKDDYWFQNNGREQGCFKSCHSNDNDKPLSPPKMNENPESKYYVNKTLSDAVFTDKEFEYGETIYDTSINSPKKYDTGICMTRDSCQKSESSCKNSVECWPIEPSIAVSESVSHCIFGTKSCPEGFFPDDVDACEFGGNSPFKTTEGYEGRNLTSKILQTWRESLVLGYILEPELRETKYEPLIEDRERFYKQRLAMCPLVCSPRMGSVPSRTTSTSVLDLPRKHVLNGVRLTLNRLMSWFENKINKV